MPRPNGQLDRVLGELTVGLLDGQQKRAKQLAYAAGEEYEQQIRVQLGGRLGEGWSYIASNVYFPLPFLWRPAQRDAPFATPHFSYGVESTGPVVVVQPSIQSWLTNNSSLVEGARIGYSATAPGAREGTTASVIVHLTFQGYAGEIEEGEEA